MEEEVKSHRAAFERELSRLRDERDAFSNQPEQSKARNKQRKQKRHLYDDADASGGEKEGDCRPEVGRLETDKEGQIAEEERRVQSAALVLLRDTERAEVMCTAEKE